jgi:acyl carrier protein
MGAAVHVLTADLADRASLVAALAGYESESWPAIRGVIHCAGVIEDQLLADIDLDSVRRVAAPKALAACYLHDYFAGRPLDAFILFSSSGALLGALGQGAYAAANACLDALACARRAGNLPVLAINWGFWRELGFAATSGGRRLIAHMRKSGLLTFSPEQGLEAFARLLAHPPLSQAAAMRIDWRAAARARQSGERMPRLLDELLPGAAPASLSAGSVRDILRATEPALRGERLESIVRGEVASVLRLDPADLEPTTPLGSFGIDSFTAIELRSRLERAFGIPLSATIAWNYPTIAEMAQYLAQRIDMPLTAEGASLAAERSGAADLTAVLAEIEALSEEELARLLSDMTVPDQGKTSR